MVREDEGVDEYKRDRMVCSQTHDAHSISSNTQPHYCIDVTPKTPCDHKPFHSVSYIFITSVQQDKINK